MPTRRLKTKAATWTVASHLCLFLRITQGTEQLQSRGIASGFMNWRVYKLQTCWIASPRCTHNGFKEWDAWWKALCAAGPQVSSFLFLLVSAFSCSGRFLCTSKNTDIYWYIPVLAEVNVYQNDHCAALLYYSLGPYSAKPLSTLLTWSIYLCIFLKHRGWL